MSQFVKTTRICRCRRDGRVRAPRSRLATLFVSFLAAGCMHGGQPTPGRSNQNGPSVSEAPREAEPAGARSREGEITPAGTRRARSGAAADPTALAPPSRPASTGARYAIHAFGAGGLAAPAESQHVGWAPPEGTNGQAPEESQEPARGRHLASIDANGRFATTYRPGRGHLAAFEAALSSGRAPPGARELVGDFGARYAPEISRPERGALAHRVDLERSALQPGGGVVRLRVAMRSTERSAAARSRMSVHLVLDASGSMAGASIDNARNAARELVSRLHADDTFSLTRFSSEATVLVTAGPVGSRRDAIHSAIASIEAVGGTNISEGLRLAYLQAARVHASPDVVQLVLLLSDGRANAGFTNANELADFAADEFQRGVQTSTIGVGTDFDAPLMSAIADFGAGGYYYVRDSSRIAEALARELDARVQPVAQAVEVRVRLRPDVELVQTYGSRRLNARETAAVRAQEIAVDRQTAQRDNIARDRREDLQGGMRFFIPGFARDDRHVILLGLRVPAGSGSRELATVEFRYKDRLTGRNVIEEAPVRAAFADSDAASLASVDRSVARTVQGFDAGETMARAARLIEQGDRMRAGALLQEREEILRQAATRLAEPQFALDAARFVRMREVVNGSSDLSEGVMLALLLDTSARGYMH